MRKEFIPMLRIPGMYLVGEEKAVINPGKIIREIRGRTPWACEYLHAKGGVWAFESADDYETHRNQN